MAREIERKFLVNGDFKPDAEKVTRIIQGYLSTVPERTVRVRIMGEKGYLTVKGIGNDSGISRYEWEMEIPVGEAEELLKICEQGVIEKNRYRVKHQTHLFEVDEFLGDNQGLVIAEVELQSEEEVFQKPTWIGQEVTGNPNYYNATLIKDPFKNWC